MAMKDAPAIPVLHAIRPYCSKQQKAGAVSG